MKYLDFEKHIKKELEGSKETVQMDALLTSLNLGRQPKRKGFALWMIIPFLLITLSALAWKFMDSNQGDLNKDLNKPFLSEAVSTEKAAIEVEPNFETSILTEVSNSEMDEEAELSNETQILKSEKLIPTPANIEISTTNNHELEPSIINNKTTPAANNKLINQSHSADQNNVNNSGNSSTLNTSYIKNDVNILQTQKEETNTSKLNNTLLRSRSELSIAHLDNSVDLLEDTEVDGNLFSRMKINCPSFDDAGWHMALIPEVGVFLPMKTLESAVTAEETTGYFERLKSESTLEGIEFGLHGMLVRDNVPLYLKAGISYSRISERMDLSYSYVKPDTTVGIISTTVSGNGDTITHIWGDIITETTYKGSNRQHHYIHLFDIPISIGYTTYLAGLDIGIEGGVKVNFMTRATGNLLTSRSEYTNLSLNKLFKNRIDLSYFGGLMIGRNFGKFGDIYIAPRFTYYPGDFNNDLNNVTQRYFSIGLNAGVVYKIN